MHRVDHDSLERFARALLSAVGATDTIATDVAASLVRADLRGHSSHGVLRVPLYEQMIDDGAIDPVATPTVTQQHGATAVVDGNDAFGHVVGREAVSLATDLAAEHGVSVVGLRNASHLGRIGEWGERVADEGFLFTATVNTGGGARSVAPAGSVVGRLSTNPIVYAVPTYDRLPFPIVLDMATSQVARGKISQYRAAGKELPPEWVVSPTGGSIVDPDNLDMLRDDGDAGALRPLGGTTSGYKGTGLSLVAELFAGTLGQAPVVGQAEPTWFSNAASFVTIDPAAFSSRADVEAKVAAVTQQLRDTPSHPDVPVGAGASGDELLLPGEAEHEAARSHTSDGVPIPDRVRESLGALAASHGVDEEIPAPLR